MNNPDLVDPDRVSAEIEAEAEKQRRQDRDIAQFEREIEQAWTDIAPSRDSSEAISDNGHLLDQTASLAALDPHVPIGSRRGLGRVKWLVRKLTYWYIRFLTDQFNLFAGMLIRHLRSLDARLGRLEAASGHPDNHPVPAGLDFVADAPEPSSAVVSHVAEVAGSGPCLVLSGGEGAIVEAIGNRGIRAHGVERDPERVLVGLSHRLDIRTGNVLAHLVGADDKEFGTIVLTGMVEKLPLGNLLGMIDQAGQKLKKTGRIIVAVADPASRGRVESELGSGLGISPVTWRHLLEHAGFDARLEPCPDSRITEIVVAERSASSSDHSSQSNP